MFQNVCTTHLEAFRILATNFMLFFVAYSNLSKSVLG